MTNISSILQLPHYYDSAFRISVLAYIDGLSAKEQMADLFIIINSNYVWSSVEFSRFAGYKNVYVFLEKDSVSLPYIEDEINTTYRSKFGYRIASYELPVNDGEPNLHTRVFHLERYQIRILYLTDEDNDTIRKCKDIICNYCTEYKYNFIHYSSSSEDNIFPKSYRDIKDRIDLIYELCMEDDYTLVLYNYCVFVNQKVPLHTAVDCIYDKNPDLIMKIDTENNLPVLDNILIRKGPRTLDVLRELMYFSYDLTKMMKYIRLYLFREISYTMFYSYFNKRITLNQIPMSYDMVYNLNNLSMSDISQVRTLINYYSCHQGIFTQMTTVDGKVYAWGSDNIGCKGTVEFKKNKVYTSWGDEGIYRWLNANTYRVEFSNRIPYKPKYSIDTVSNSSIVGSMDLGDGESSANDIVDSLVDKFVITFIDNGKRFVGYSDNGLAFSVSGVYLPFYNSKNKIDNE